jgi:hypothetical protein
VLLRRAEWFSRKTYIAESDAGSVARVTMDIGDTDRLIQPPLLSKLNSSGRALLREYCRPSCVK